MNKVVQLCDGLIHVFLGYTFSHQTAVPLIVKNNKVIYNHKSIRIMAWGDT